jgi:hypothetical protein
MVIHLPTTVTGIEKTVASDQTQRKIQRLEGATRKSAFWCEEKDYFYQFDIEEPYIIILFDVPFEK